MKATPQTDTLKKELDAVNAEMRKLYQRQQDIEAACATAMADEVFGITKGVTVEGMDALNEFKKFVVDKAYFFNVSPWQMELWVMSEGGARLPAQYARVVPA